jgi:3-oxoacyl-[acyl-carrier protein] reductase
MRLAGKVALVTGGASGMGRSEATIFAREGARVVVGDVLEAEGKETAAAIAAAGGQARFLRLDVTREADWQEAVRATVAAFGQLDVLVNNAGTAKWRPLEEVPDEDWQAAWELNVMAPLRAMRAVAPAMAERGWGRIVNVSSTAAKRPSALMPEYSVAKAAELSLSRLFADRYAGDGVLVNAVCPGPTKSQLWMADGGLLDQSQEVGGHSSRDEALEAAGAKRPIGRLAEVEEVAGAIVFLCSERASYVAGAAWSVDGGTVQVII